jgi:hypothetical protein
MAVTSQIFQLYFDRTKRFYTPTTLLGGWIYTLSAYSGHAIRDIRRRPMGIDWGARTNYDVRRHPASMVHLQ